MSLKRILASVLGRGTSVARHGGSPRVAGAGAERLEGRVLLSTTIESSTWGDDDLVTAHTPGYTYEAVRQPDGKLLVVGYGFLLGGDAPADAPAHDQRAFTLARYDVDGSIDESFGAGGFARAELGDRHSHQTATDIVLQPDGKIVLVGYVLGPPGEGLGNGIARFNPDGSLDATFGVGGVVVDGAGGAFYGRGVTLDAQGRLLVAGSNADVLPGNFPLPSVSRYTPDGALDTTFGTGGRVVVGHGLLEYGTGLAVVATPDGDVVLTAIPYTINPGNGSGISQGFYLARLNGDGSLDAGFGEGGQVLTRDHGVFPAEMELLADGTVLVGGAQLGGYNNTEPFNDHWAALARYRPDGSLDPTFGDAVLAGFGTEA